MLFLLSQSLTINYGLGVAFIMFELLDDMLLIGRFDMLLFIELLLMLLFIVVIGVDIGVLIGVAIVLLAIIERLAFILTFTFVAESPQARPKALNPRTVESAITFLILFQTPNLSQRYIYLC